MRAAYGLTFAGTPMAYWRHWDWEEREMVDGLIELVLSSDRESTGIAPQYPIDGHRLKGLLPFPMTGDVRESLWGTVEAIAPAMGWEMKRKLEMGNEGDKVEDADDWAAVLDGLMAPEDVDRILESGQ